MKQRMVNLVDMFVYNRNFKIALNVNSFQLGLKRNTEAQGLNRIVYLIITQMFKWIQKETSKFFRQLEKGVGNPD